MITCGECKYWGHIRDEDYLATPFYVDPHEIRDYTWPGPHGECMLIGDISYSDQSAWLYAQLYIPDISLITQPTFGCVLGEKRALREGRDATL